MSASKKTKLELSDSSEDETDIKVNASYAESYNRFREKELLQKLKDRYKDGDESSSSSSESEEEDYPEFDNAFFKTLSLLKEKNSKIYDEENNFFPDMKSKPKLKTTKSKKFTLRDLERTVMTEKGGKFEDIPKISPKGYYEELDEIKESFKGMDDENDDEEEEGNDDNEPLLQAKTKTAQEVKKEEDEYKLWLMDQKNESEFPSNAQDLKGLKEFWSRRDLDPNEKFLRDYILKEKYKDEGDKEEGEEEEEGIDNRIHDSDDNLSEDEKTVQKMEEFETKFNFRFEEPDPEFIKRYPRTIEESMRKKDESRKRKRETTKLKKEMEKSKKREELKQLKSLKRAEILEKIKKIQNVAGTEEVNFEEEDLEEDFDPESYDKRMEEIFKNYDDNIVDEEKPVFPDIGDSDIENELEVEHWDDWEPQDEDVQNAHEEESAIEHEETANKETFQKEVLSTLGRKKVKRKSKFAEIIEKKKPIFDSKMNKTFETYLNEYYKLDFEDIIGDLPCRFKYRNVPKNAFGLEVEEILSAPDRELNAWCSLKKTCQYRDERDEKADIVSYENKRGNIHLKQKILPSLFVSNSEENLEAERIKKSKKSKRNRKSTFKEKNDDDALEVKSPHSQEDLIKDANTDLKQNKSQVIKNNSTSTNSNETQAVNVEMSKNNRKRKRNKNFNKKATTTGAKNININAEIKMSDQRLEAYGLAPGKFKRKIRQKKFNKK